MGGFTVTSRGLAPDHSESVGVGQLPASAATTTLTDVLGRTQLLGSTAASAPAILSTVSVMDAPWSAKCDARVVTDGAITSATNSLSSASAVWAIGQLVKVNGAGPNVAPGAVGTPIPGILVGYVKTVAGTTVTLVTTPGGSTPANASATVSGATVAYGTDDTSAVQSAITAVSATASLLGATGTVGQATVPSGRSMIIGSSVTPKNNTMLSMYGATIHLATSNATSNAHAMMFEPPVNTSVSNWHLRGGTFQGTGTEAGNTGCQGIMYWHNTFNGGNGTATYTDISVRDITVTNWATGVIDIRGGSRIRILENTFRSCSTFTGTNTVNIIMGGGSSPVASSDVFVQNNYIDGNGAECIAIGEATAQTGAFDRAVVTGNICQATGGAAAIDVEWSTTTTGKARSIVIANNVVKHAGTGGTAWGIAAASGAAGNTDPFTMSRVLVVGNVVDAVDGGINVQASEAIIALNHITAGAVNIPGVQIKDNQSIAGTADTNGTTTLLNAPASATISNGDQLTGTNIQAGTYLVSGAGTTTWTISQAATGTTVGGSITAFPQLKNVQCVHNLIHLPSTAAHNAIFAFAIRDSLIHGNIINVDPGSTVAGQATDAILLQRSGWTDVSENRIDYAASHGVEVNGCNDCHVQRNRIYNPSEAGGSSMGVQCASLTGKSCRVTHNLIVDDRAAPKMANGVNQNVTNALVLALDNEIRGAVSGPLGTLAGFGLVRNNITDLNTFPAATSAIAVTASPFTYTNADPYYEDVYVDGGTVSNIQHSRPGSLTRNLANATNLGVRLGPGESVVVAYSVAPTMVKIPLP